MRHRYVALALMAGVGLTVCAEQASALSKCTAKIDAKDGTVYASGKEVVGTLRWGWTETTQVNEFFGACTGSKCAQGEPGTLLAITPPPNCTLHLKDDVDTCTAFLKKCTPGTRPLVEFPTRFIDHGDGTVTDTRTGLMWEQKTDDGGIHDKDAVYAWSTGMPYNPDGSAFFTFLTALNGPTPFAGYGDWRLPSLTELKTIVDPFAAGCGSGSPCLDQAAFGPTLPGIYWSATTFPGGIGAFYVDFHDGDVDGFGKTTPQGVRAVRDGS